MAVPSGPTDVLRSLVTDGWRLDRGSEVPAYVQIEERLVDLIESGRLVTGERLPSERDLASWVGVSRLTARAATGLLVQRGLVERGVGRRGTVVARSKLIHDLGEFGGFTEIVRRQGLAAGALIRALNELAAPEAVARELQLAPGARVYRIERLRLAGGEPVTLEDSWIPANRFPALLRHDLSGSLYRLMGEAYDSAPVRATERLEPALAHERHADALAVSPGAALMLVVRVAYAADGTPVEYARDHHRGDRAQFVVRVSTVGSERH